MTRVDSAEVGGAGGDHTDEAPAWLRSAAEVLSTTTADELLPQRHPVAGPARPCAILIVFSPVAGSSGSGGPDESRVLLTERAHTLRSHAAQVSFPGGVLDPADDGPVAGALREAAEETGLDPNGVQVVATLPQLHMPWSANVVTPVLAWAGDPSPVGVVDSGEVASVHWVPVRHLLDPTSRLRVRHPSGALGPAFYVPDSVTEPDTAKVSQLVVWGFTGGLMTTMFALAGWERPWDRNRVEDLPEYLLDRPPSWLAQPTANPHDHRSTHDQPTRQHGSHRRTAPDSGSSGDPGSPRGVA